MPFMFKVCLLLSTTTRVQLSTITAAFIQQSLGGGEDRAGIKGKSKESKVSITGH